MISPELIREAQSIWNEMRVGDDYVPFTADQAFDLLIFNELRAIRRVLTQALVPADGPSQ